MRLSLLPVIWCEGESKVASVNPETGAGCGVDVRAESSATANPGTCPKIASLAPMY